MPLFQMVLAAALSALPSTSQEGLIVTGMEQDRYVLVSLGGVPDQPTVPFRAVLFAVPANCPPTVRPTRHGSRSSTARLAPGP